MPQKTSKEFCDTEKNNKGGLSMKARIRRQASIVLVIAMLLTLAAPVSAQEVAGDISGHWAEKQLDKWIQNGIICGYGDGTIRPNNSINNAEFIALISRVFNFVEKAENIFSDIPDRAWYTNDVLKALYAGVIADDGTGRFDPTAPVSRQKAAVILYNAFRLEVTDIDAVSRFRDASGIEESCRAALSALVENGYMVGKIGNIIAPADNLTRAEFVVLLDKIAGNLIRKPGTYSGDNKGNLVVNTRDVVLRDMVIDGDLFLTEGIGDGEVVLDNVTVKGRTVVKGGGENSIVINNSSLEGTLLVVKADGKIKIVASGSTEIPSVKLGSGALLHEKDLEGKGFDSIELLGTVEPGQEIVLEGDFDSVFVNAPGVKINVADGTVRSLEVGEEASGALIDIADNASVGIFTANSSVNVTGNGNIDTANINSNNVKIEKPPAKVNISEGVTAEIGGKTVTDKTSGTGSQGTTGPSQTINAPAQLFAGLASYDSASLKWTAVNGADGYNIYRSESENGSYARINLSPVTALSHKDTGLDAGKTYYYKVTAVKGGSESPRSGACSVAMPSEANQGEWKLVWADEFNGVPGTGVDTDNWMYEVSGSGFGNNELQYSTDRPENVFIKEDDENHGNGMLVLRALKEEYNGKQYTSGRIKTDGRFDFTYGKVEMRAKLPDGKGIGCSFWMLGSDFEDIGWPACGEIDIMEWVGKPVSRIYGTIHGPGYSAGDGIGAWHEYTPGFTDEFHTYAVEWEPGVIRWYFDGELYEERTPIDLFGKDWVFDHDFYIILGLGVGGNWPGSPDETTTFPQDYIIDYVRVYQREGDIYPEAPYRNIIQLKNPGTNKYVCADKQQNDYLYANRDSGGAWETFELKDLGEGKVAIRALTNYKYVSVSEDNKLIAVSETAGDTEKFILEANTDGTISLKSVANGKYVHSGAEGILTASSDSVSDNGKFVLLSTPEPPTGLKVKNVTNTSATLEWDAVQGASGYNVYRSGSENDRFVKINDHTVTDTEFTDTGVTAGKTYYYKITAINALGQSDYTTKVTAEIPEELTVPAPPSNLSAVYGTGSEIGIKWSPVTGATGYNVYRSGSKDGEYVKVNDSEVTGTVFADTGLSEACAYYYKVTAVNDKGESAQSAYLFATTTGYGIYSGKSYAYIISAANNRFVTADGTNNMAPLKAAASDAASDDQLFEIIYKPDGNVGFASKSLNQLVCAESYFAQDYRLLPRSGYSTDPGGWETFTIVPQGDGTVAIKANNGGKYVSVNPNDGILRADAATAGINEKFIIVVPDKPSAPIGLSTTDVLDTSVALSWTAPASTFLTGYNVYRAESEDGQYVLINDGLLTTASFTDTGLTANKTYYYKVTAVNYRGETSSAPLSVTTLKGPVPAVPSGLDMTFDGGSVNLIWDDADNAEGYNVYRASGRFGNYVKLNSGLLTANSYTDLDPDNSFYYYRITAVNENGESKPSEPVSREMKLFGPNVYIFSPDDSASDIQAKVTEVFELMQSAETAQFSDDRYALLFKPGNYTTDVKVGYYTHVAGLGRLPTDTAIRSLTAEANLPDNNSTCNFWRSAENLTVNSNTQWAVSQAVSLRRMKINGNLVLHQAGGWVSGGFLADSHITGNTESGSQQQWFSRNTYWNQWLGGVWNMVFVGIAEGKAPAGTWPETVNTTIDKTPVIKEKPFLYIDETYNYKVFVPALRENSKGISWGSGMGEGISIPVDNFYIASPETDTADTINAALAEGRHLLLTPGIYYLDKAIEVNNANTVVFGLGLPALIPTEGNACMKVADVDGVTIAGVLFDAGEKKSPVLLEIGPEGSSEDHCENPTVLSDLYFRVGGRSEYTGKADVCIIINGNNVIGDNFWVWRADHGANVAWDKNVTKNGIIVNGDNVTIYALMVEHFHEYQTVWNGEGGRTYFYQSEIPYDVPYQAAWMSHNGTKNGYASYKVADHVTTHEAWGLGVYSYHRDATVDLHSAVEVPDAPGVRIINACSVMLAGNPGISHVVNDEGGAVTKAGQRQIITEYCNTGSKVRTPVVLPEGSIYYKPISVTIDCGTEDAIIRYTTDGSEPSEASAVYSSPILIDSYTVLKVKAFREGLDPSDTVTQIYDVDTDAVNRSLIVNGYFDDGTAGWDFWSGEGANGVLSNEDGRAKVYHSNSDGTANWNTMLTQGEIRLEAGRAYVLCFDISGNNAKNIDVCVEKASDNQIKYLNNKSIKLSSEMTTYSYEFASPGEPVVARLVFLLGGSSTAGDTIYIDNIVLWEKDTAAPDQVKTPSFNIPSGVYNAAQEINISCMTSDAKILYTTDGSDPTEENGTEYTGPFIVSEDVTIKAIAVKTGMESSAVASITLRFTDNFAFGKECSASSGDASLAFDGDMNTRWETEWNDPQWIMVDLGKEYAVSGVKLVWQYAAGKTYKIQVSTDNWIWLDVFTVTDGAPEAILEASFPAVNARYVRMYGTERTSTWGYSIWEFEVYANKVGIPVISAEDSGAGQKLITITPATSEDAIMYTLDGTDPSPTKGILYTGPFTLSETTTVKAMAFRTGMFNSSIASLVVKFNDNIALGKPAEASSVNGTNSAGYAVDGNDKTRWESVHDADPQYLIIDLEKICSIRRIKIIWEGASAADYKIEVSTDKEDWTEVLSLTDKPSGHILEETFAEPVTVQYIRVYGTRRAIGYGYSIWEFEVYGSPAD